MAPLKTKRDMAELIGAADLVKRGYRVAFPFGEDCDFDVLFWCPPDLALQRVQVKYAESDGRVVPVRCRSASLTNGKVKAIKQYTQETIDWIAVYDRTTDRCYYVPAVELGRGRHEISLRLVPAANNQRLRTRRAEDYLAPTIARRTGP